MEDKKTGKAEETKLLEPDDLESLSGGLPPMEMLTAEELERYYQLKNWSLDIIKYSPIPAERMAAGQQYSDYVRYLEKKYGKRK